MDWDALAEPWLATETEIEATLAPIAQALMAKANLSSGQRVLDIGCGMGSTVLMAARAVGEQGYVAGLDIAPPLANRAANRTASLPQVEILTGDAQTFAFPPDGVDTVISMLGTMFFSDSVTAFANIKTALRRSGRFTFSCWAGGKDNPWFTLPAQALVKYAGELPPPAANASGPMVFADTDRVLRMLAEAGWQDATFIELDLHLTPMGSREKVAEMPFRLMPYLGVLMNDMGFSQQQAQALLKQGQDEFARNLVDYDGSDGVRIPAKIRLFSAQNI